MAGKAVTKFAFNEFCKETREGDILYNLDNTSPWGKYLLVAAKSTICVDNTRVSFLMLIRMKEDIDGNLEPTGKRVDFTFDKAGFLPYLKNVGHCKYSLSVNVEDTFINETLIETYKNTTAWSYSRKRHYRKPKHKKWDADGRKTVKDTNNINKDETED